MIKINEENMSISEAANRYKVAHCTMSYRWKQYVKGKMSIELLTTVGPIKKVYNKHVTRNKYSKLSKLGNRSKRQQLKNLLKIPTPTEYERAMYEDI